MLGTSLTSGSGISGLFSGVPGLNTSIFDYGSYYTASGSGSSSNNNSALGWAIGGIGVGMFGLLLTTLINRSQSENTRIESENSQNLTNLKAALKDLGLGEDVDSVTEADIDSININDDNTLTAKFKETSIYAPVKTARENVRKLEDERNAFNDNYSTNLNALKPEKYTGGDDIYSVIAAWKIISEGSTSKKDDESDEDYQSRMANILKAKDIIPKLENLKAEKESWDANGENDKKLTEANAALTKAKEAAEAALTAKKTEAKDYLRKYQATLRSSRSINDVDGTAVGRLFAQKHATVSKSGVVTMNNDETELTDGDMKTILARYRNGNSSVKANIKSYFTELQKNDDKFLEKSPYKEYRGLINSILNS